MATKSMRLGKLCVLAAVCVGIVGCPTAPDVGVTLLVSPTTLDFGDSHTSLTFQVRKNYTSRPMSPFIATPSDNWVEVSPVSGVSRGPDNAVTVTVTVNRELMVAGNNSAKVTIKSEGAADQEVRLTAVRELTANFAADELQPFLGDPVLFSDRSAVAPGSGPITGWLWDFGDGETSTEQNPRYVYSELGTYDVTLTSSTAHSSASLTKAAFIRVRAKEAPAAAFRANNQVIQANTDVVFTDQSTPGTMPITAWMWDFGDGASAATANPVHRYVLPGSYTVSLTVTTLHGTDTETKVGFITVESVPPQADFDVSNRTPVFNSPVQFFDRSAAGTSPITSWAWDFGDGMSSTETDPIHVFSRPGSYTVSLTVISAHGTDTETKASYINVPQMPPRAGFSANNRQPLVGEQVQFLDRSIPGSASITQRQWSFGDGATSTQTEPRHTYTTPGQYTVSLTVTDADNNSDTSTVQEYIWVRGDPPAAGFSVDKPWGVTIDTFQFTNLSETELGTPRYTWYFGDGSYSVAENPSHRYDAPGSYTVTLVVETDFGSDIITKPAFVKVYETKPLDRYVRAADAVYSYLPSSAEQYDGYSWHVVSFISQQWRTAVTEVNQPIWTHWLAICVPDQIQNDTSLLFISGGGVSQSPPVVPIQELVDFSVGSGSVVAYLRMVPNQPIIFTDEPDARYVVSGRVEDELLAYSFDRYMQSVVAGMPDEQWPALLPMAKSAVRAMDTVQTYLPLAGVSAPAKFVVTGASKRGWTTWLTAATDPRVVGLAPMVIDVLNIPAQMSWHHRALCGYSEAIEDYVDLSIFERLATPQGQALNAIIDPFAYRERLTVPKLGLNGTSDEFFLPDSAQFYINELKQIGPTFLRYFPNGNHYLHEGYNKSVRGFLPFYNALVRSEPIPRLDWVITAEGNASKTITVQSDVAPEEVLLWKGTVAGATRDFRLPVVGDSVWVSETLPPVAQGVNRWSATVPNPGAGKWTGFFIELTFPSGTPAEKHILTTEVQVVPSTLPCSSK